MTDSRIYDRFNTATRDLTAQALLLDGKPVGRIVIRDAQACSAFVQIWGASMAIGKAGGGGYDRHSAAVFDAIGKLTDRPDGRDESAFVAFNRIRKSARSWNGGTRYAYHLESAGFTVCNVI